MKFSWQLKANTIIPAYIIQILYVTQLLWILTYLGAVNINRQKLMVEAGGGKMLK